MDVDPPPSHDKCVAPSSPSSSSLEKLKRVGILLSDAQLDALSKHMKRISDMMRWRTKAKKPRDKNDPFWWRAHEEILMEILEQVEGTSMRNIPIPHPTRPEARNLFESLNEEEWEQWKDGVENGIEKDDWTGILAHPKIRIPQAAKIADHTVELSGSHKHKAIEAAWQREYLGQAAEALWKHIVLHYDPTGKKNYAQFCWVIQSSGMGKSRTADELGKTRFCIPINLRIELSTGYPPADHTARDFLTMNGTEAESYRRVCCFIDALFHHTDGILKTFDSQWGIEEVARQFRFCMTAEQSMKGHNEFRKGFYDEVVRIAKERLAAEQKDVIGDTSPILPKDIGGYDFPPASSFHKLLESLKARIERPSKPSPSQVKKKEKPQAPQLSSKVPIVVLVFDEAHTLTNQEQKDENWSNLSALQRALHALSHFPMFSLFLSTRAKMPQFTSASDDASSKITVGALKLSEPFTDLGFDTLAKKVSFNSCWTLGFVTHDSHIVHLGRPLFGSHYNAGNREDIVMFAVGKLLNDDPNTQEFTEHQKLACLSQRFPIQFNSTTYISHASEMKQVEEHLRVCLKVDANLQNMETVSPSEPLLSEAAYVVMAQKSFQPLTTFKSILEGCAIHQGDRGEFLVLLLLNLARDQTVGCPGKNGHPKYRFFSFPSFVYGNLFKASTSLLLTQSTVSALKMLMQDFPNARPAKVHESWSCS